MSLYKLLKKGDIIYRDYHLPQWSLPFNKKTGTRVIETEKWQVTKIIYRKNYNHSIYLTQISQNKHEQLFDNHIIDLEFYLSLSETLKKL